MNASDRKLAMQAIDRWKIQQIDKIGGRYLSTNWNHAPAKIKALRRSVKSGEQALRKWENRSTSKHRRRLAEIEKRAERLKLEVSFGDPRKVLRVIDGK